METFFVYLGGLMKKFLTGFFLSLTLLLPGGYSQLLPLHYGYEGHYATRAPYNLLQTDFEEAKKDPAYIDAVPSSNEERQSFYNIHAAEIAEEEDAGHDELSLKKKSGSNHNTTAFYSHARLFDILGGTLLPKWDFSFRSSPRRYLFFRVFRI